MEPQELTELPELQVRLEELDQGDQLEHPGLVDQLVTQEMPDQWDLPELEVEQRDLTLKIPSHLLRKS